MLYKLTLI